MDLERAQWKESRCHVGLFTCEVVQATGCQVGVSFKPVEADVVTMFNWY